MKINITDNLIDQINKKTIDYFLEISKIPRGSSNEKQIAEYLIDFAEKRNLEYKKNFTPLNGKPVYNVVIIKPASKGCEDSETVILQSHIDMVCQKSSDSNHDFSKDPLDIIIDENYIRANKTTLGADDGVGVAFALAVLDSREIAHPKLEVLFTSDEENGMTGAIAVDEEFVSGKRLINLDSETEGTLFYGCASSVDANFTLPLEYDSIPEDFDLLKIEVTGLKGGHSGMEIHYGRANAHILLARVMQAVKNHFPMRFIFFKGGDKFNVITKEASAVIGVKVSDKKRAIEFIKEQEAIFIHEYEGIEEGINIIVSPEKSKEFNKPVSENSLEKFLSILLLIPNGVEAMHGKVEGLVETSSNLGKVQQEEGKMVLCSLVRSFHKTKKEYLREKMRRLAELTGAEFKAENDCPSWKPNPKSDLITRFSKAYKEAFGVEPKCESIHAGLECGYFSEKFPDMDLIACGPTITGAHTIDEQLDVKSLRKFTELLLRVLSEL